MIDKRYLKQEYKRIEDILDRLVYSGRCPKELLGEFFTVLIHKDYDKPIFQLVNREYANSIPMTVELKKDIN